MTYSVSRSWRATLVLTALVVAWPQFSWSDTPNDSIEVVKRFVAAYNDHDVDQMMTYAAKNIRWLTVISDAVSVEADGKEALSAAMQSHFASSPSTQSALLRIEGDGPMVVAIEQAMADADQPDRSQCSASVYQIRGGLIVNVWYFHAYHCGQSDASVTHTPAN